MVLNRLQLSTVRSAHACNIRGAYFELSTSINTMSYVSVTIPVCIKDYFQCFGYDIILSPKTMRRRAVVLCKICASILVLHRLSGGIQTPSI